MTVQKSVSLTTLGRVPVVRPERAGPLWEGIKHSTLINTVIKECKSRGWKVPTDPRIAISRNKTDMAAAVDVVIGPIFPGKDFTFTVGVLSSTGCGQTWGLKVIVGATHKQGWGMAVEEVASRQWTHRVGLDVDKAVNGMIESWYTSARFFLGAVHSMKGTPISSADKDHVLLDGFRGGVLHSPPWEKVGKVDAEWQEAMANGEPATEYTLYSCFAKVVRKDKPGRQFHALLRFYKVLSKAPLTGEGR